MRRRYPVIAHWSKPLKNIRRLCLLHRFTVATNIVSAAGETRRSAVKSMVISLPDSAQLNMLAKGNKPAA